MEDIESHRKQFEELKGLYARLGHNVNGALETFLKEENINYLTISYRIKEVESFIEKIERKQYEKPFDSIEDICGLRIICYYQSDIERICKIIETEFDIQENQNKEVLLNEDQFGYRSYHYVGKIKEKWLEAPNYRGLNTLKFEIQVRTILMHTWAEIEHKLAYKQKIHIPSHLKRKLYLISAKLEEADEQFEGIKNESLKYRNKLVSEGQLKGEKFYKDIDLDLDSLQSFLDFKFPNRSRDIDHTRDLLNEMIAKKVGLKDVINGLELSEPYLVEIEKEIFKERLKRIGEDGWAQVGIVRRVLDLTSERYFNSRFSVNVGIPGSTRNQVEKWRKVISKNIKK